jgi:hypothetical protein
MGRKAPSVGSATCRRRDARGSAASGDSVLGDALLSLRRVFCVACRIAGASGSPARRAPTRAIIIATGAAYRRLPIENLARFEGAAVYCAATFYAYACLVPEGFSEHPNEPTTAYFHSGLREFLLPFNAVHTAEDPDATPLAFVQSTNEAVAVTAGRDGARSAPVR